MQNDLISKSELHDAICKRFNIEDDWDGDITEPLQTILDIIENFEIAYDVEEVVVELEEEKYTREEKFQYDTRTQECMVCYNKGINRAIRIIRNGGKE